MRRILPPLWIIGILLSHLLLLTLTRFTLWPEMLVYPYLLNHGFQLYRDIINPYPPILTFLLSIFTKQFSYDVLPVQILTWSTIIIVDLIIFVLSLKITKNQFLAFSSLIFFAVFSVPFGVNGIWFDLFQTLPILLAVYMFYNYLQNNKNKKSLIFSFCLLAVAYSIKQQAVWLFAWFTLLGLITLKKFKKKVFHFLFLTFIPFIITAIGFDVLFLKQNTLSDFLFWTVYFPFFLSSSLPGYILFPSLRQLIVLIVLIIIFLPTILRIKLKVTFLTLAGFVLFIFAYPRFDYFHLIPSLSVLSLGFGKNLQHLARSDLKIKFLGISAVLLLTVFSVRYFQRNWTTEVRFFENEVYRTAKFLQIINSSNQPVFLQNVSGQILVVSGSLPTKPWADSFPWYLEIPDIQEKVIAGIKNENPALVIYKPYQNSGEFDLATYRPKKIADYLDQNYKDSFKINDQLLLKSKTAR